MKKKAKVNIKFIGPASEHETGIYIYGIYHQNKLVYLGETNTTFKKRLRQHNRKGGWEDLKGDIHMKGVSLKNESKQFVKTVEQILIVQKWISGVYLYNKPLDFCEDKKQGQN